MNSIKNVSRYKSKVVNGFTGAIGNTPIIKLERLSKETGCTILAKAEFMNPGGSVKDRAAMGMILEAEKQGLIKENYTIVEGTAGNTGIGLAHVCRDRGYKCVIFMPNNQSQEKIDLIKTLGAEVHCVPQVPYEDPKNYNHQAKIYANENVNCYWTNQFDNIFNANYHKKTTGPEIWTQLDGKIDGFICATGTGGTLAGVGNYLKEVSNGKCKVWLADPPGSILYKYFTSKGQLVERSGSSITEGIGQGRITDNLKTFEKLVDNAIQISDEKTIKYIYELLHYDGIFVGASTALNVVSAVEMAKKLKPGSTVVTILCDAAYRYQSRLFSKKWLQEKNLLNVIPKHLEKYITLA